MKVFIKTVNKSDSIFTVAIDELRAMIYQTKAVNSGMKTAFIGITANP
jgi:hypothetical protein